MICLLTFWVDTPDGSSAAHSDIALTIHTMMMMMMMFSSDQSCIWGHVGQIATRKDYLQHRVSLARYLHTAPRVSSKVPEQRLLLLTTLANTDGANPRGSPRKHSSFALTIEIPSKLALSRSNVEWGREQEVNRDEE